MCTAASFKGFFGRNLDFDFSYGQEIVITPRNYSFSFKHEENIDKHPAIIGAGIIQEGYPLYFDAINEYGLGMAGLNFVGNCVYRDVDDTKINIAQFELIPYVLSKCKTLEEAKELFKNINLSKDSINEKYPPTQMHWYVSDGYKSIVVESVKDGVKVYDDPVNVLTNNPPFELQMFNLNNYQHLSPVDPVNNFEGVELAKYSRGMGGLGLPGDLSSMSRFVKVAFTNHFSLSDNGLNQLFHILHSVEQQNGCCKVKEAFEYTIFTSACDLAKGIYYYTTYNNHQISGVDMHKENLDSSELITYPMLEKEQINMQN